VARKPPVLGVKGWIAVDARRSRVDPV